MYIHTHTLVYYLLPLLSVAPSGPQWWVCVQLNLWRCFFFWSLLTRGDA